MPNINNWTLTLFNQDVREMLGFKKRVVYKLVSGERVISDKQLSTQSKMELCATEQKELAQLKTEYAKLEKQVKTLQGKTKEVSGKKVEKEIPTKKEVKEKTSQKDIQVKEVKTESAKAKPEKVEKTQGIQKVVFGSCTDLRSGSSEFVLFSRGLKLRFDQARQEGSINGIMPQLILKNDFFRAKKTREIVDAYIKQGINKIIAITGAGPTNAVLDLVKNKKILLLFPSTGLPEARSPEYTNLVLYRTDDIIEGRVMVNYAVEKLKTKSGVLLVQDDHFGHSLLLGIKPMLKKLGVEKKWTTILNEPRKTKLDKQVEQIKKIKPDTIIFCGPISVAMAVIRQIGIDKLAKVKLIGNSDFASEAMQKFVKDKGLTLINPVLVPNPKTSDLEIVRQFRKAAKKANIPYDVFALESYITADITFDILKKIKGKVTNEKIMKVIENIKNYDYKGFKLNFNPQNRQIAQMMWIDTGSSDKWEPVSINKFL